MIRLDQDHLFAFLDALTLGDFATGCVEMRVFNATFDRGLIKPTDVYQKTLAGWYSDPYNLEADARRLEGVSGYITVNPVTLDLLARADNKLAKAAKGEATNDTNILTLRWAYIDIDPIRPSGISSTEGEFESARTVQANLLARFPEIQASALWGCSGNGAWILVRLPDFPNTTESRERVVRFIRTLRALCSVPKVVDIDVKTINASRVMCLPGTRKCKGSNRPERPWRFVTFDSWKLGHSVRPEPFDLDPWLVRHEVVAEALTPILGGPNGKAHTNGKRHPGGGGRATLHNRIVAYMAKKEPAIQGQDGSGKTFDAAFDLVYGWDLGIAGARPYLEAYSATCQPPWTPGEIEHKLEDADKREDSQGRPRGYIRDREMPHTANGAPHLNGDADCRIVIPITTAEHEVGSQASFAIGQDATVFQRANVLVTVLRDSAISRVIQRPPGLPRIATLQLPTIRELLTKNADWIVYKPTKGGEEGELESVPSHPPTWAVAATAARGDWPTVRPIETVIESPILRPDGSIMNEPGYDAKTGILFEAEEDTNWDIPVSPTPRDATNAAERLLDIVADFPFKDHSHRAAWLAALLTPMARFAIAGACPLFLFDANGPGSGKSLLSDVIAMIATGRAMPRTAYPDEDEEMRKRITSIAMAGDRMMLLDNIAATFGGSALDSALTATSWRDRILGKSEMTGELSLFTVWFGTGNNVLLRGDVLRRVVPCRLETLLEKPEERGEEEFAHPNLLKWVKEGRQGFVRDVLTILRAYVLAGRPRGSYGAFGSFEAWSNLVRSAVWWVTGYDPCSTREVLRLQDPETSTYRGILNGWGELPPPATQWRTAAAMLQLLAGFPENFETLRTALMEWSRTDGLPTPKVVGVRLKQMQGRVFDGKRMVSRIYQGTLSWRVEDAGPSVY